MFVVTTFMPTVLKSIIGNTSKRRNFKSGSVPTIFKHKMYDMINMNGCNVKGKLQQDHQKWTARSKFIIIINELLLSSWAFISQEEFFVFLICLVKHTGTSHIGHLLNSQIRYDWFQVSIVIKKTNYNNLAFSLKRQMFIKVNRNLLK